MASCCASEEDDALAFASAFLPSRSATLCSASLAASSALASASSACVRAGLRCGLGLLLGGLRRGLGGLLGGLRRVVARGRGLPVRLGRVLGLRALGLGRLCLRLLGVGLPLGVRLGPLGLVRLGLRRLLGGPGLVRGPLRLVAGGLGALERGPRVLERLGVRRGLLLGGLPLGLRLLVVGLPLLLGGGAGAGVGARCGLAVRGGLAAERVLAEGEQVGLAEGHGVGPLPAVGHPLALEVGLLALLVGLLLLGGSVVGLLGVARAAHERRRRQQRAQRRRNDLLSREQHLVFPFSHFSCFPISRTPRGCFPAVKGGVAGGRPAGRFSVTPRSLRHLSYAFEC